MKQPTLWPFFSFYGAKWRIVPRYPAPRHDTIIEPFAGSASYALRYPDRNVVLVERDPVIAGIWQWLVTASETDVLDLPDIENGQSVDDLVIPEAARSLIGYWLTRGGIRPNRTPGKWMRDRIRPASFWGHAARVRIASQLRYIRHWVIVPGDYTAAPDDKATWFIDPPYQAPGRHYRYSTLDYTHLATWSRERRGQVLVCEQAGASWLPFEPLLMRSTQHGRSGTEVLYARGCSDAT